MSQEVKGEWVIKTMQVAVALCPDDANVTLTILTRALARTGKILGVPKEELAEQFERAYDLEIIPKKQ